MACRNPGHKTEKCCTLDVKSSLAVTVSVPEVSMAQPEANGVAEGSLGSVFETRLGALMWEEL